MKCQILTSTPAQNPEQGPWMTVHLSKCMRGLHGDEKQPLMGAIWSVCHFRSMWLTEAGAFISKNTENLQPRRIWLIGSWVFDLNIAYSELVALYLYEPATKEVLLLKWERRLKSTSKENQKNYLLIYILSGRHMTPSLSQGTWDQRSSVG